MRNQLLAKKFYKRCIVFTQLYRNPPELKTQKVTAADPPSGRARTGETRCKSMGSPAAAGRAVAQSLLGGQRPGGILSEPVHGEDSVGPDVHMNLGSETRREIEPTFFFMLNCLLYSRLEKGFPSNQDFYDEDVNVYLANLLCSFMKPEYHKRSRPYLSPYDSTLFEKVANSTDARLKYTIYKTNADFLLISIGIFNNAEARRPDTAQAYRSSEEAYMGRGKAYYHFAYTYSQSAFRKSTGIAEILEKLSKGFERYIEDLEPHARRVFQHPRPPDRG